MALDGADSHHLCSGLGEAGANAREREECDAGHVHVASTEVVGRASAEQKEARKGEHVGVDDPLGG
jgi:hypothetical protein